MTSQSVQNKQVLLSLIMLNSSQIKSFGVKELGVFGSFKRNTAIRKDSDVDLIVGFEPGKKTFDNFMDLSFYLEGLLGRKVELLTHDSLSKYIGPHILKEVEYVKI